MTYPVANQAYSIANGIAKTRVFITIFETRNPTPQDVNYEITQRWLNTAVNDEWILVDFTTINEVTTANWHPLGSAAVIEFLKGNSGGPVGPDGSNIINVLGDNASGINVIGTPLTHTLTIFNSNGLPTVGFTIDAFTPTGTNPVLPNSSGLVTITGAQVAAGTTTNVIRTDSLAANKYTIEIQRSQAVAASTIGDNGVSHFNSAQFTVDANGFVSLVGGGSAIESVALQSGTTPIVPLAGQITFNGATVAAGTNPVRTDGTGAHTMALEVQISQAIASTNATNIGLSAFNSTYFTVDANGFVSLNGSGVGLTITGNSGGALPPTAGNWNIFGASTAAGTSPVTTSGSGSTLTVNVQKSQAIASTNATNVGLSAFNSADFTVDANGFVSIIGGPSIVGVIVDAHTAPGTSPVLPNASGDITVTGGQVAAGTTTNVIQTNSLAANTYTVQVQRSQAVSSSTVGDNGVCHFNSNQFTVDGNAFVTVNNGGFTWNDVSGAFSPLKNNGYFITGTATGTLPASPAQGDTIKFFVDTTQFLTITASGSQIIRLGTVVSSAGGTMVSTLQGDSVELVYRASDTCWCSVAGAWGTWVKT